MADKSYKFAFALAASMSSNFNSTFTSATQKVNNLRTSFENLKRMQTAVQNAYDKKIIKPEAFENAKKQIDSLNRMNQGLQKAAATEMFQKSFVDATAFYYGVKNMASFLTGPIQAAKQFESVMADVKKVVDFDTPDQFKQMGKDIINLSKSIPMTAEGLAKIVAAGGQSGIARDDLTQFAESAAKMGIAFDITADQAGEMMAKWRTAFKMNQQDVVTLADKINYLGNTTAASAPLISDVVTRIGPLGAVGGLAAGEIAAMGASLVGSGVQSEVAATGLKNFILAMTAGESATKTQHEAFARLGLDAQTMATKMQKDAKGAIIDVLTAINSLDKVQQGSVLKDLFGKESIGAIAPLLTNLDNLKTNFDGVADATKYAGSMQSEFNARSKTTDNSVQLMENRVNAAKIAIGVGLLPVVVTVSEHLGKFATVIGDLATEYPGVINGVIGVTGTLIAFGSVVHMANLVSNGYHAICESIKFALARQRIETIKNTAATLKNATATGIRTAYEWTSIKVGRIWKAVQQSNTIELIKNEIAILRKAAAEKIAMAASRAWTIAVNACTAAQRLFNLALAGTPIGLVLVGISALVVAGTLLYKNWDKVKTFFTNLWESPTARMLMFVTGPIGWVIGITTAIIANWDKIKDFFEYLWDNPTAAIFRFTSSIKELFQGAIDWVKEKWQAFSDFLSQPIFGRFEISGTKTEKPASNASGGIYGKGAFLTTFAEESGESAIPHTPTKRNIGLLAKTNQIMGNPLQPMLQVSPAFNPTINVTASAPAVNVPPAEVAPASVNVEQAAITAPSPVIQIPESKPILQAPPVVKNIIQAVADSPIVKTFVNAVAAVPEVIVNPASPVMKPSFTAMAQTPVVNPAAVNNVISLPKMDAPMVSPVIQTMAKPSIVPALFDPLVQTAGTPDVNFHDIPAQKETLIERIKELVAPSINRQTASAPPVINIHNDLHFSGNVNQQEVRETVDKASDISFAKFREFMIQYQHEQRRVRYE